MLTIVCEKQFKGEGNYTQEDIVILNSVIESGIKELKTDWASGEYEGITLTETKDNLKISLDETKIDFVELFDSIKDIKRNILGVINNYGIPYREITQ